MRSSGHFDQGVVHQETGQRLPDGQPISTILPLIYSMPLGPVCWEDRREQSDPITLEQQALAPAQPAESDAKTTPTLPGLADPLQGSDTSRVGTRHVLPMPGPPVGGVHGANLARSARRQENECVYGT